MESDGKDKKKKIITFPRMAAVLIAAAVVLIIVISAVLVLGRDGTDSEKTGADEAWWAISVASDAGETADSSDRDNASDMSGDEIENEDLPAEVDDETADTGSTDDDMDDAEAETAETSEAVTATTEGTETTEQTEEIDTEETAASSQTTEAVTEEQAEESQDASTAMNIMVNGYMYTENGETTTELPAGFDYAGAVSKTGTETPTQNMQGQNIPTGAGVYTSSANNYIIYIEISGGTYEQYIID